MAYNSPDIESIEKTKEELENKITDLQEIGLPGVKDIPKTLWEEVIKPKLLTERQVAKKMIMLQGETFDMPITEEDAQLIVYGKIYKKNGKLYDNDEKDSSCISKPGDEDYIPPINLKHPMISNIKEMIKKLKKDLLQLGIKIGEFLVAIPASIINIATSLIALVSSAIVLPFGAGLPAAITAVQTMILTLTELQAKTAALLPLIGVVDAIALLLPKDAQVVVAQINIIYGILLGIITGITTILGLLAKVTSLLTKKKKKMDEQKLDSSTKAEPSTIKKGEESKLSAEATGGNWDYTYSWTSSNGTVISTDSSINVKPISTTTYTCKISDSTGTTKSISTKVEVED